MLSPVVKLTQKLISCPSISPYDAKCQKIISRYLKKLGFKIEKMNSKDTSNLWAYKNGLKNNKTLAFVGHTDVVPIGDKSLWKYSPFDPIIEKNFLFGRGSVDMKGSLASMIIATERFLQKYPNHKERIGFLITSDEESKATNGTKIIVKNLIQKKEIIDYCIIGEPTSKKKVGDTIKNGRRGSLTANLTIHGIQGHVAYPQFAKNPIHQIIPFLKKLIKTSWDQEVNIFPITSMQIVKINVENSSSNTIPSKCFLEFNFRFGNITVSQIKQRVLNILKKNQLNYSLTWNLSAKPFFTKSENLINIAIESIKETQKVINPIITTDGGTSDGRFLVKIAKEIIECGVINEKMHQVNECVDINDLKILSIIYEKILKKLIF